LILPLGFRIGVFISSITDTGGFEKTAGGHSRRATKPSPIPLGILPSPISPNIQHNQSPELSAAPTIAFWRRTMPLKPINQVHNVKTIRLTISVGVGTDNGIRTITVSFEAIH
jgi:hypothetical protein